MQLISDPLEMRRWSRGHHASGKRIGLVPTMGYLHEGHLRLIDIVRNQTDLVVVSVFVNPTQFGPGEDFLTYPRDLARDRALLRDRGAHCVFVPETADMYDSDQMVTVVAGRLATHLCGPGRPGHFDGVLTIVAKLFNVVEPDVAVFGRKDYQQLLVIRQMVKDLNMDIEIVGEPTVREADGIAMSSRNSYLTSEQRPAALTLSQALNKAQEIIKGGERDSQTIIDAATELITSYPATTIDYISICDPETLVDLEIIDQPALMALAVKVGKTRLIDNMILDPQA